MEEKQISSRNADIEKNFDAFQKILPEFIKAYPNKYVLLRHQEVIATYSTALDAVVTGQTFYKDGLFSVQKISPRPENLGFFLIWHLSGDITSF